MFLNSLVLATELLLLSLAAAGSSSSPGGSYGSGPAAGYGYNSPMTYLPALPGKRPKCAGQSETFCEQIDYYPTELIEYLLKGYSYDFSTLLQDETNDVFRIATSPLPSYSAGTIYVPSQGSIPKTVNVTQPPVPQPQYETPVLSPFVSSFGNPNEPWWSRYLKPSQRREYSEGTNRRVARQTTGVEQLCPTTSQFIMPKAAVNTKGNWMFVVNLDTNNQATQLVKAERCATTQCSGLCQVPAGFTSTCQQQFVQKRLVALNGSGENLYTDTFWFPHCCTCQIQPTNG